MGLSRQSGPAAGTAGSREGGAGALIERLRAHLERRPALVPRGSTVLVALSGGPDSMALLHLLREVAPERCLRLIAAHFDHGVRPGSAAEAHRVAGWAAAAGISCTVGRAPEAPERTQAAFRRARYRFLSRAADDVGADRIATGHQADDQAETILHRIVRGTGIRGLAGIPARRGRTVRPLLPFGREELRRWLEARGIDFLQDPSNADRRWTRARIRHDVLPALERATEGPVRDRLLALGRAAARAERALEAAARTALRECRLDGNAGSREAPPGRVGLSRDALLARDPEIRARVVQRAARRFGHRLTRGGTRSAAEFIRRGRSGTGVQLADGLWLRREFDALWIGAPEDPEPDEEHRIDAPAPGAAELSIGGRRYRAEWGAEVGHGHRWARSLSPRAADFPLVLRGPRPGDRIRLRRGTRKLKKLFNEHRVPRSERPRRPVLAAADGRLVWAAGIGAEARETGGATETARRFAIGVDHA